MANDGVRQAAAVNPGDKFELVFRGLLQNLFAERMDQNEDIFVRFMNDAAFQNVVTRWMSSEAYRRLRSEDDAGGGREVGRGRETGREREAGGGREATGALPPTLRLVDPPPAKQRYVTCLPLVPLKAAAGAFGDVQRIEDDGFDWVTVESGRRLRRGMFVAQVVGRSMEPAIPDGAYCLFRAPVEGTRQGRIVLVQMRDDTDPESGQRYTVKRYGSEKAADGDSWRHTRISLDPINPDFQPIVLTGTDTDDGQFQVVAEVVEVLGGGG